MKNTNNSARSRIHSLDMARGIIVVFSVFLSSLPYGSYDFATHASWYGLTLVDFILPCFITVFGVGMAIAYQKGVKWKRFISRTIKLILFGLLFNIIVAWSFDLSTLRFTGVLQMYALLGIGTVLITRFIKRPITVSLVGLLIFSIYGAILLYMGQTCEGSLPQPGCNPSWLVDPVVFGESHIYSLGERGFDPEGIPAIFSALGNVLLGFAAGRIIILYKEKGAGWRLLLHGVLLLALAFLVEAFLPFGKRLWTPSFGLVTAGATSLLLALLHIIFDRKYTSPFVQPVSNSLIWILDSFGRNAFLIYFGKYIIFSLLRNLSINGDEKPITLYQVIFSWLEQTSSNPALIYATLMLGFWTIIAIALHKVKWYFRV
ncbi:heparan-alpha-glucosaminide N-acetyltransferase domain-containing protein [Bacillus timonensis]|uniref:heparan-alpha-glucosaminide N-acetyltransferase domain-containing protein n=1 Tax=Bacillus timonensis TaxID=1033734 RepID=UPI0002899CB1|nr:heparan-alpha-glucosaminide N-acetyltransferase domain-containing protein [Bacillus timonensis]